MSIRTIVASKGGDFFLFVLKGTSVFLQWPVEVSNTQSNNYCVGWLVCLFHKIMNCYLI